MTPCGPHKYLIEQENKGTRDPSRASAGAVLFSARTTMGMRAAHSES